MVVTTTPSSVFTQTMAPKSLPCLDGGHTAVAQSKGTVLEGGFLRVNLRFSSLPGLCRRLVQNGSSRLDVARASWPRP